MKQAVLLLGTNLGDGINNLKKVISLLENQNESISKISSVYKTEPWGFESQNWFYNLVVVLYTKKDIDSFFGTITEIEKEMGRNEKTTPGYADRLIDIDILFFGNLIINRPELCVPHPRLHLRNFALYPLCEVMPDFIHPVINKSLKQLSEECNDNGIVIRNGYL